MVIIYPPRLNNPNHPDLVQAVRDGQEDPYAALNWLLQNTQHAQPHDQEKYRDWFKKISLIAIEDKPEISLVYNGKIIFLARDENNENEITYQVTEF